LSVSLPSVTVTAMTADMGGDELAVFYFQPHVYGSSAVHILALAP
jgi:hypothetical protein